MMGTVKWFSTERGYGFITPESGGSDVFFHHSGIDMAGFRSLVEGQRVEFEMGEDASGRSAAVVVRPLTG